MNIIVCMSKNKVIGKENRMPWHLPKDLAYFKKMTLGKTVVMGRKTFESIGKALPGRNNIILTRDPLYKAPGCQVYTKIEDVLHLPKEDVFIIGGSEIYTLFMPYATKLYITKICETFEGDAFFPETRIDDYRVLSSKKGCRDANNDHEYYFMIYEKKE